MLEALREGISHRGPDGDGVVSSANVGLCHCRLSILDLTEAASQPMRSEDGMLTLVFNGEIYDFKRHREDLLKKGHTFTSSGDTEVLLKLYQEYGPACVPMLRGMFAFAVHDARRGILFLAGDRVGKKPIKYFRAAGMFAFASELKALRAVPGCPSEIDREALHHFLTAMYLPAPLTGLKGIEKLPPAHTLTVNLKTGEERLERYWQTAYRPDETVTEEEWIERVRDVFEESVRLRMIADVPVGAFLSGGIDSAAVVAFMAKHSQHPVKTFTIGSDDPAFDESSQAAEVASTFGTEHHPIRLEADIVRLLPELVRAYEEPYADPSSIPTYLVARETRKHVTVALNGDGGDENFAGYVRYSILPFSEAWRRMPGPVHALALGGVRLLRLLRDDTLAYRGERFVRTARQGEAERHLQYLSYFTEEEKAALYRDGVSFPRTDAWYAARTAEARARGGDDIVRRAMAADMDTYLADDLLPKVDLGTMAHGLEARSPFLDHTLLELTSTIPTRFLLQGRQRKLLLKKMLRGVLPDATLDRKKRGFRLPLDAWFRGPLAGFVEERLLDPTPGPFWEMFDRAKMEAFLKRYHTSRIDYSDHVWALLWLREWLGVYT